MAKISKLTLPVTNESTGQITSQTFDIGGQEYTAGYGINIDDNTIAIRTFIGTQAEWEALSSSEQAEYVYVNFTDDYTGAVDIDPVPISHSDNLVTSGGVFSALEEKINEPSIEGSAGQVLTTDGEGGRSWTTISSGSSSLSDLSDVNISSATNGQVLSYNVSNNKWINSSLGTSATKGFTTSVTSGSSDLVTSGGVYSYVDTMITQAFTTSY